MSGRLGMDMDVDRLSTEDREVAKAAIATFKSIRETVQLGDQYRLESPYLDPRSSLMYVRQDEAVLFVYSPGSTEGSPLVLKGLQSELNYAVVEINRGDAADKLVGNWTGNSLMQDGLHLPSFEAYGSAVFKIEKI